MIPIKYVKVENDIPAFKDPNPGDAGYDMYATKDTWIWPWKITKVPLNIRLSIPNNYFVRICGRSGLTLAGKLVAAGTIDSSYRGQPHALMYSLLIPRKIKRGERVAQAIFMPCSANNIMLEVTLGQLDKTERGDSGFGNSGRF